MTIKINIIEAACELAQKELERYYEYSSLPIYNEIDDETSYTEEAQQVFNEFYDKYFDLLYNMQEPVSISIG